jgi:hypothetical protein
MLVIDNFMPTDWWKNIHEVLDGYMFPWYLFKQTSYAEDGYNQMVHIYYMNNQVSSNCFEMVQPIIYELEKQTSYQVKSIDRIKSNLLFNRSITEEQKQKVIHQDMKVPKYVSLLYYVKDSDGDTVLYKDDKKTELMRVQPKANRAVIFDSRTWHTGELPVKNQTRIVINCILEVK